jgi:N-acylneuraminate cytidylyltransferase
MTKIKEKGIEVVIISSETNSVVSARAKKMRVEVIQGVGINDKASVLADHLTQKGVDPSTVVFIGNDINDISCFEFVGWAVAVADAMPPVLNAADHITKNKGGHGAVREICDLLLESISE